MKKIKIAILSLLIVTTATSIGIYGYLVKETNKWSLIALPGVKIENLDISGKTKAEAKELLKQKFGDEILKKNLTIKAADKSYILDYSKLNARYDIDAKVEEALSYGKNLNVLQKYKLVKSPVSKTFKLQFSYDAAAIKEMTDTMKKDIDIAPMDGSIAFESGSFKTTPDKKGQQLDTGKLQKEITDKINGEINSNLTIEAPINIIEANKTEAKLSKVDAKISSYTTNFSGSSYARINNITLATKTINGTLLMPGEQFSFNGIVGERTEKSGYQMAPVIVGNKVESGLGGGICQVSTTLFNSILRTKINYKDITRQNHTLPSHYVPLGLDATVDYSSSTDFKFKNTFEFPIYISGYIKGNNLYFDLYSNSSLNSRNYEILSEKSETMEPKIEYINDSSMPAGTEEVQSNGSTGYKVNVYKITYENGNYVSKDLLYSDTYFAVNKIVKKGTKTS